MPPDRPPATTAAAPTPGRIDAIDWLRGLAVVLMIQAHGFDAWLRPDAKVGAAYGAIRFLSGLPSRMFPLLVGVAAAIKFESQLRKGVAPASMRAQTWKRGLLVIGLAYLFRLQEYTLAGFHGSWETLFRVDILNCIGASLIVLAFVATPRRGRPQIAASLAAVAIFVGLGPVIGPAHFPAWIPRPLSSYFGGQRPMAWFTLFPWAAWMLVGVAVGHLWLRFGRDAAGRARVFLLSGVIGGAMTGTVILIRRLDPYVIRYPSELVQQMGPGSFFYRLGILGITAALAWAVTRISGKRFSPMRQLGQTSLLIYWIHVDLCYGGVSRALRAGLSIPWATAWIALLTLLMLGVSLAKTRYARPTLEWLRPRLAFFAQIRFNGPRPRGSDPR